VTRALPRGAQPTGALTDGGWRPETNATHGATHFVDVYPDGA
jgi:hypothetical protein